MKELKKYKYVLFDAANTLIHKPMLWEKILSVFEKYNIKIPLEKIQYNHKLISEIIDFPDRTSKDFYSLFNKELLISLGIIPSNELIDTLYTECSYLPWEKFSDTEFLKKIPVPIGVLSNFNKKLPELLESLFGNIFSDIIVSESSKMRKPTPEFYDYALTTIGFESKEILYIGDSLKLDVIPAKGAGFEALLINRNGFFGKNNFSINNIYELNNFFN